MIASETISAGPIDGILVEFRKKVEFNVIPGSFLYCNGIDRRGKVS